MESAKSIRSAKLRVALCLALAFAPAYGDTEECIPPAKPPLLVRCALSLVDLAKKDLTHLKSGRVPLRSGLLFTVLAGFGANYLGGIYHRDAALKQVVRYGHLAGEKLDRQEFRRESRDAKELSRLAAQAYAASDLYFAENGRTHFYFRTIRDAFFWQLDAPTREARFRHWEENWTKYEPIPPFPPSPSPELYDEAADYDRRTAKLLIAEIGKPHSNLSPEQNKVIASVLADLEPAFWAPDDLRAFLLPTAKDFRLLSSALRAEDIQRLRQKGLHGVIEERVEIWTRDPTVPRPRFRHELVSFLGEEVPVRRYELVHFFEKEVLVRRGTLDGSALLDWVTDELLPTLPEKVRAPVATRILDELEYAEGTLGMRLPSHPKEVGIKLPEAESIRRLLESISISEADLELTDLQTLFRSLEKLPLSNTEVDFFAEKLSQNPVFGRVCEGYLDSERPTFLTQMLRTARGREILQDKMLDSQVLPMRKANTIRALLELGAEKASADRRVPN